MDIPVNSKEHRRRKEMRKKGLCMAATLLAAAIFCSGCSTDASPSGNTTVGQQSSAAQTGETVKKETDTSSEKEAPAQDGGNKIVNNYEQNNKPGTCAPDYMSLKHMATCLAD